MNNLDDLMLGQDDLTLCKPAAKENSLTSTSSHGSLFRPLWIYSLMLLAVLIVSRIALVSWQLPRVNDADMLAVVFLQGLRFDLVLLGLSLSIPVLLFPIVASNARLFGIWRFIVCFYLPAILVLVLFMECNTPSFIAQFDSRPNILFLEYLDHPREVIATLWATEKGPIVLAVVLCVAMARFSRSLFRGLMHNCRSASPFLVAIATPLFIVLCTGLVRSTLDHRPVNPSTVALSNDPMVNDLALNSAYTLLYSVYETRHEPDGGFRYAPISDTDVFETVRSAMKIPAQSFVSEQFPTLHKQIVSAPATGPKNLVIILEESLGAEFVGSLGGFDITPNLDALSKEGIWFENLYATGTRSVRGIEAVISGFTPTPARSVVKLGKSQKNFFTLGELLASKGYNTSFLYGGESHFDNMRRFFMNNGFDRVVDKSDYVNPVFTGSWGVSDEDLFNRAHDEFTAAAKSDKPFFSLIFTSSNHSPYEFPDDRVTLVESEKNTVKNAVKYADYALGHFIETARESDYWKNTVFLIVADHNSRVYGANLVPVEHFHVPALILGESIEARVFKPIASQIDLPPTLLSLVGVSSTHPMIGHDLTRPDMQDSAGRAIMQYNGTQAYMVGERVLILRKNMPALQCVYNGHDLVKSERIDPNLRKLALAHSAWSSLAYQDKLYRL